MGQTTLIIGEPRTGKSYSIRNLNPEETYIINVVDKALPFPGGTKNYQQKEGGNYYSSDNYSHIIHVINSIIKEREDIKTIIIDD